MFSRLLRVLCVLVAGALVQPAAGGKKRERPDFTGTWVLNTELSDDLNQKVREAMASRRRVTGGYEPGRSVGDSAAGIWDRLGNAEELREQMNKLVQGMEQVVITYQEPVLTLRFADGRVRTLSTDGTKEKKDTQLGKIESRARWKKDTLRVETWTSWGRRLTETFYLGPGPDQLSIDLTMLPYQAAPEVLLDRVYERTGDVPPGPGEE